MELPAGVILILLDSVKTCGIFMELIITQFIQNPDRDKQAAGHTQCQPGNVYKGIAFMSFYVSQNDF
ncbi:hypothetical protein ES703_30323 [subsurface metagenome]